MLSRSQDASPSVVRQRLRVRKVPLAEIDARMRDQLWDLYAAFYNNIDRQTFDRDLAAKEFVFIGREERSGEIVGFSTGLYFGAEVDRRRVGIYYSGDTVFDPRYWGHKRLHWAMLSDWLRWRWQHRGRPLYWYLVCSGHRTYLSLVRNFPTHWPDHRRPTPAWEAKLLDTVGRRRFGDKWQPETGLISTGGPQAVFKPEVDPLTDSLLALPEMRFFVERNPHHARGDELAMVALVDAALVGWFLGRWSKKLVTSARARVDRRRERRA